MRLLQLFNSEVSGNQELWVWNYGIHWHYSALLAVWNHHNLNQLVAYNLAGQDEGRRNIQRWTEAER